MKYLILENIRSAYNVGAIFRTADAAGVSKIFLIGYTPAPIDRFGRVQSEIEKTSLGASQTISWEHHKSALPVVADLQEEGVSVVAIEQTSESVSLPTFSVPKHVAYVMGNEVEGVSKEVLDMVDQVVDIPMLGMKESLNVSVATGIVLYHGLVT
ncbi:MAG: TrmH family RNA methyltransferase [Candidatus Kaiserbacteria bacterium]|nr:TrmH family RNA methyltransferase [Candidatus Kaiserbacteria bacterium]MCB9816481.1 TrmH family RNA methyltransferase [Candidatus Nomurabacteria bacterium]